MAKAEGLPPTASIASVGPGIRYIGDWAYAYSGLSDTSSSNVNYLEFTSGTGLIVSKIQPFYRADSTYNLSYIISFNGIEVYGFEITSSMDYSPYSEIHLIIPPYTEVTVSIRNLGGGTSAAGVSLTGRVYGAA